MKNSRLPSETGGTSRKKPTFLKFWRTKAFNLELDIQQRNPSETQVWNRHSQKKENWKLPLIAGLIHKNYYRKLFREKRNDNKETWNTRNEKKKSNRNGKHLDK